MTIFVVLMEPNMLKKSRCDVETHPVVTQHGLKKREHSEMEKKDSTLQVLQGQFIIYLLYKGTYNIILDIQVESLRESCDFLLTEVIFKEPLKIARSKP